MLHSLHDTWAYSVFSRSVFWINQEKIPKNKVEQLSKVVTDSTLTGANKVQRAFDKTTNYRVPCYDWKTFLSNYFKPIPSILKYQHFYFSSENPGIVELQENPSSEKITVDIRKPKAKIDHTQNAKTYYSCRSISWSTNLPLWTNQGILWTRVCWCYMPSPLTIFQ